MPAERDVAATIERLRKETNAVILAHYYQEPAIQDLADFVGDSLDLSRRAAATEADVIVFAGVHFMAETAKILNPGKRVLIPDLEAGCSLAESAPPAQFRAFLDAHPGHFVVSYINCTAAIKAMSDVICTSSNAVDIVRRVPPETPIVFAPDYHLGRWVERQTGRKMVLWQGSCIVHERFSLAKLQGLLAAHPGAEFVAHPECDEALLLPAAFVGSTAKLIRYVRDATAQTFIVATEPGILHAMQREAPGKTLIPAPHDHDCPCNVCPHMRLHTPEKIARCLETLSPEVTLAEELRLRALAPIQRMLDWSR